MSPRIGLGVLAERHDAPDAGALGAIRQPRELRIVAVDDGAAARLEAEEDLGRSAMASSEPKNSRCTGSIVVTIATCGRTRRRERLDLAGMVHAELEHRIARAAGQRASDSGTPQWLL